MTTVEDDQDWFVRLEMHIPDADLRLVRPAPGVNADPDGPRDAYVHAIDTEPDRSFDLVIVDGQDRHDCVLAAMPKVRSGGMLLLDDSQWSDTVPPSRRDVSRLRQPYRDLPERLAGWEVHHLPGLKPGTWLPVQTSVWIKP